MRNGHIEQVPIPPNEWLYKDESEDLSQRLWRKKVSYREGSPAWNDATEDEYQEWKSKYEPEPEPENEKIE